MAPITQLTERLGHEFGDRNLLKLALSHCSAGKYNNERLEFLGDSILGFIIGEALYQRFPEAREGELSRLRARLVQRSTLADIARELRLGEHLILGSGELKSGGANRESILSDALEAVICALYLDGGLELCRQRVLDWFASRLAEIDLLSPPKDPKTRLQEYLQSRKQKLPQYEVAQISGKDHQQVFSVTCDIQSLGQPVIGYGSNRREAEQRAAELALKALGA